MRWQAGKAEGDTTSHNTTPMSHLKEGSFEHELSYGRTSAACHVQPILRVRELVN